MAALAAVIGVVGLSIIQVSEGEVLRTYLDPVGIPTACYGHTGPEVRMGQTFTHSQCTATLLKDIAEHRKGLERCLKVPVNPNQRDALVSLTFNIGVSSVCKSTLLRKLNRNDYVGASKEFSKWHYATEGRRVVSLPGLVRRRAAERALFVTPWNEDRVNGVHEPYVTSPPTGAITMNPSET